MADSPFVVSLRSYGLGAQQGGRRSYHASAGPGRSVPTTESTASAASVTPKAFRGGNAALYSTRNEPVPVVDRTMRSRFAVAVPPFRDEATVRGPSRADYRSPRAAQLPHSSREQAQQRPRPPIFTQQNEPREADVATSIAEWYDPPPRIVALEQFLISQIDTVRAITCKYVSRPHSVRDVQDRCADAVPDDSVNQMVVTTRENSMDAERRDHVPLPSPRHPSRPAPSRDSTDEGTLVSRVRSPDRPSVSASQAVRSPSRNHRDLYGSPLLETRQVASYRPIVTASVDERMLGSRWNALNGEIMSLDAKCRDALVALKQVKDASMASTSPADSAAFRRVEMKLHDEIELCNERRHILLDALHQLIPEN